MLIKDPSRFQIRNACSKDCVQLYQLVKQCYLEIVGHLNRLENGKRNRDDVNGSDLNNNQTISDLNNNHNKSELNNNQTNSDLNNNHNKSDLNNNQINKDCNNNLSTFDSFEEFVDCLGFGKRGDQRKVLDCLLIEDLNNSKIIALVTYSYGYFSYVGKEIHMNHFYVRPDYRLNGFGRFLMQNLIKLAAQAKLHKLKYDGNSSSFLLRQNDKITNQLTKLFHSYL